MDDPETEASFYHVYGLFIARWNSLEEVFKILLQICSGGNSAVKILTEQMTNRERANALLNIIKIHERSQAFLPFVTHAVSYFERLEQYRNYYVHEIRPLGTMDVETGRYAALSATTKLHRDGINTRAAIVKVEEIESLSDHCIAAGKFISDLVVHLAIMPEGFPLPPLEPLPDLPAGFSLPYQKADARDHP